MDSLLENIARVAVLKDELHKRSMIYACAHKEQIASFYGLPINTYYDLSYADYTELSAQYCRDWVGSIVRWEDKDGTLTAHVDRMCGTIREMSTSTIKDGRLQIHGTNHKFELDETYSSNAAAMDRAGFILAGYYLTREGHERNRLSRNLTKT